MFHYKDRHSFDSLIVANREVGVTPSKQMSNLIKAHPELVNYQNTSICHHVEENILLCLIIRVFNQKLADLFKNEINIVPLSVSKPFSILENLKFKLKDKNDLYPAGTVLLKTSIGAKIGLVIDGPYAGLIINYMHIGTTKNPEVGIANKIWTQKMFYRPNSRYQILTSDLKQPLAKNIFEQINFLSQNELYKTYEEWLNNQTEKRSQNLLKTLLGMCNITTSSTFHYTIPI